MAFNGHQHDNENIDDDDGTPTKQPRSDTERPVYFKADPDNEAVGPAGRVAAGRIPSSRARHRSDSVKKTRPRRCYTLREWDVCIYWKQHHDMLT